MILVTFAVVAEWSDFWTFFFMAVEELLNFTYFEPLVSFYSSSHPSSFVTSRFPTSMQNLHTICCLYEYNFEKY